jgi:hypothetical protein
VRALSSRRPARRRRVGRRGKSRTRSGWCGIFTPRLRFKTLEDLNGWLADKCVAYAKAHRHPEQVERKVWDVFEEERASFIHYAGRFDGFHCIPASVSKTCTVRFD